MKPRIVLLSLSVAVLATTSTAVGGERRRQMMVLKSIRLETDRNNIPGVRIVPLNTEHIVIRGKDDKSKETKKVPVTLVEMFYRSIMLRLGLGKPTEHARFLDCYELRSTDPKNPYTWVLWSLSLIPMGRFRLFSNGSGENYLAWVSSSSVYFAEVSKPRDRVVQLRRFLDSRREHSPPAVHVPIYKLVKGARDIFSGRGANDTAIEILSVERDKTGSMRVRVRQAADADAPRSHEVFTFVCEKGKWRKE